MGNSVLLTGPDGRQEITGRLHDLTESSLGVLCDVARGGLKVDLSSVFESSIEPSSLLTDVRGVDTTDELYFESQGSPRWSNLKSYYELYKRVQNVANKQPQVTLDESDYTPFASKEEYEEFADAPDRVRLLPVISKVQMVFSMVSHEPLTAGRKKFYDVSGNPRGHQNYGVPMLCYDPVVTLHNPYDVEIRMPYMRVRIWDPPVVFRFKKNDTYVRTDFEYGRFSGLAMFQLEQQGNPFARKYFNLILSEKGTGDEPGDTIVLKPGEVKVFSPYVEDEWTWGLEVAGYQGDPFEPRAFFDTETAKYVTEKDFRKQYGPLGEMGVHCVPGWNTRAGLCTDHLGQENSRPQATIYPFDRGYYARCGWFGMKKTDTFTVEVKPGKRLGAGRGPDFMVDVLSGNEVSHDEDLLRRFEFKFSDVETELSQTPDEPVIEREFRVGDLFQSNDDNTPGGKSPFAILTMTAKTTVDEENSTKPWLYNNHVVEGGIQNSANVGMIHQSYDVQLREMSSFSDFPGIEIDPQTNRGFYGASATAAKGVSHVPMHRLPLGPCASMGELLHSNIVSGRTLPRVTHPFGNSYAPPMVESSKVASSGGEVSFNHAYLDHSYLLNDLLWDGYYFSSIVDQTADYAGQQRSREEVLTELVEGKGKTLNRRLVAAPSLSMDVSQRVTEVLESDVRASRGLSAELMVSGMFNVNSDSVDAWRAILMSLRDEAVTGWSNRSYEMYDRTAFPRMGLPLAGDPDVGNQPPADLAGAIRWAGFRTLDDGEIKLLAESIVIELRLRGERDKAPFQSLGEFVNRRIGNASGLHALSGVLQKAIDRSGINGLTADDSIEVNLQKIANHDKIGLKNTDALEGQSGEGSPVAITQADLLGPLSSVISVRGDTFKIRTYGDSRNSEGDVVARAWCEATVQRLPQFVDSSDHPSTPITQLSSSVNERFGRRFVITHFRWLSADEI